MHQSLAAVPSSYLDIINFMNPEIAKNSFFSSATNKITDKEIVVPIDTSFRPNVIIHSSEATSLSKVDEVKESDFDVETLLGEKTSVSRVALQRCLGRWSNTTLFLSRVIFF